MSVPAAAASISSITETQPKQSDGSNSTNAVFAKAPRDFTSALQSSGETFFLLHPRAKFFQQRRLQLVWRSWFYTSMFCALKKRGIEKKVILIPSSLSASPDLLTGFRDKVHLRAHAVIGKSEVCVCFTLLSPFLTYYLQNKAVFDVTETYFPPQNPTNSKTLNI